ncbi:hypothetical protein [Bacteroides thetaiotaomicron]|uniref:hypothetical protein n=1 Tax=Bacteroides thetaiotaomicron TaxID=818 RepID=UPI00147B6AB5|nr:hypothetical protein [Bacteroides thetaiotaomicron]
MDLVVWGKNSVFNSRRSAPASLVLHAAGGAGCCGRNRRDTRRRYSTVRFPALWPANQYAAGRNRPQPRQGRKAGE